MTNRIDFIKFAGKDFRGNINTSVIRTSDGRTTIVQHDATTFRPQAGADLQSGVVGRSFFAQIL